MDIDHCIHMCHNQKDLWDNQLDSFYYTDPLLDTIDIHIADNHWNLFGIPNGNLPNIQTMSGIPMW